jgi:hypothetical protein
VLSGRNGRRNAEFIYVTARGFAYQALKAATGLVAWLVVHLSIGGDEFKEPKWSVFIGAAISDKV